jgi:rRNA biogenesis protein RRP5
LPNNLTGYVPITSISDKITQRIEEIAAAEELEEEAGPDAPEDVELTSMFSIGQYLRAYVVSTSDDNITSAATKSKRRIELSIRPQQSNNALSAQNVIQNNMVMASVASVEDHGLVMDLGLNDATVKGFMSSKEIGKGIELSEVQEGAVYLCMVTGLSSNGKIVKLSADTQRIANTKKLSYLSEAPTIDAFMPGTAVEILVTDVTSRGVIGKVMGMVDVTVDLIHSGAALPGKDLEKKYKLGSKIKGRVICTFPAADPPKLGVSLLDHVIGMTVQQAVKGGEKKPPLDVLPLSATIEEVVVRKVEGGHGLFVDVGIKGLSGFVHISRVKDGKIESLSETSGAYKLGSTHRGRVIGYNSIDGTYLISLEASVLEQPFLNIEDLKIGEIVKGKVEKLIVNAKGVGGVLVNLAEGISGLVPEAHLADVKLLHPEKKFKEGMAVTCRVLSTDPSKRQVRLTLKKSLVNSEAAPFINYEDIDVGMQSPGTIINVLPTGAVVQFYGSVRGFLPVAEMSEAYIQDPTQHFRVGQVVNVHVTKVDPQAKKLTVSCKDPSTFGLAQQTALKNLKVGEIVSAVVTEKSSDDISLELENIGLRAILSLQHLTDRSSSKNASAFERIRVGQKLTDLAVMEKLESKRLVLLSNKPSLVKEAKDRNLLRSIEDVKVGKLVHGFVKNIIPSAVFVQFGGGLTGLLPKSKLAQDIASLPEFGLKKFQSIEVKVISADREEGTFVLSMTDTDNKAAQQFVGDALSNDEGVLNPVDERISSMADFVIGKLTKARVASVKETQINVQLADNIQGRIDVSQVFDKWEEIKDRKRPLKQFSTKQILDVRVLGMHDARNHRFLPITHRVGKTVVFELSAKPSDQLETAQEPLTLDQVKTGSSWVTYINNITDSSAWVNLSPNVRGRINLMEMSDDVSLLKDVESNFPVGSAIRARVTNVDASNNRLDLSARSQVAEKLTIQNLSEGMVLPGKVTRATERQILVELADGLAGPVHLPDLADDFSQADPGKHSKNDIVRVCVVSVDLPNKRFRLSTRPSRVLDSSLEVLDPELTSITQLKANDIVRGFVKSVTKMGLFVNIGGNLTAFVRVSDLSDSYIKDWQSEFEVDQLVKGKIVQLDATLNQIQMSLKTSVMDKNYIPPRTYNDLSIGQIVTGKIRKVEDFGVFIVIDNSMNVSGLCHQSEMADKRVHNVKKLYEEGDAVKAKIIKLDAEKKRVSLGLKAKYFDDNVGESTDESDEDGIGSEQGARLDEMDVDSDDESLDKQDGRIDLEDIESIEGPSDAESVSDAGSDVEMDEAADIPALNAGGFDWEAKVLDCVNEASDDDSEDGGADEKPKKKKRKKAEIKIDRTGDLDANGPQSVADFERLLLGQPDSSQLWIEYMAFQMQLSELSKAREVAERAIKTINIREETEKMNVWIALINLESAYGSDESMDEVFKRACQYNDPQEIHERVASIHIQSGKPDVRFCLCLQIFYSTNRPTESRRTLPSHHQKVLSIAKRMVQLRTFPND